jgi:hypothetical protein
MSLRARLASFRPARTEYHWEPCCFCGQPIRATETEPSWVWLAQGSETRERLVAEYACHSACFHARLEPSLRRATGPEIQRTMDGTITNAPDLTADQVVGQRVLCPGCREMVFTRWPGGWDAHAATICAGIAADQPEARKAEFKQRFARLFRGVPGFPDD